MRELHLISDYSRLVGTHVEHSKMSTLSAAVVGLGALGNEVLRFLGMVGVGRLLLIDHDFVEPSNLSRSILYSDSHCIGRNKVDAAAEILAVRFPIVHTRTLACELADVGWEHFDDVRIVFSCVDSAHSRLQAAWLSTETGIPVCDGGIGSPSAGRGRVTWFPGRHAACFSCLLTPERRAGLLATAHSATRSCLNGAEEPDGVRTSTPTLASVVAALQVEIGLRSLELGTTECSSTSIVLEPAPVIDRIVHPRSHACPWHGPLLRRVSAAGVESPAALLARLSEAATLVLDYPICTGAQCQKCGYNWQPMHRLQRFRRSADCPRCGSTAEPIEVLTAIDQETGWASRPFRELGLPEHHRFAILDTGR